MSMREFIKVMKALRDINRVKIVKILEQGELCVCEIQEVLQVSQPTVSKCWDPSRNMSSVILKNRSWS